MKDVKHWVYSQCWSKKDCYISIFQVLQQPSKFPEHIKRIRNADLEYPLIVIEDKYDKYDTAQSSEAQSMPDTNIKHKDYKPTYARH